MDPKGGTGIVMVLNYNEVLLFPPTINAIHILSQQFEKVIVLEVSPKDPLLENYARNVFFHRIDRKMNSISGKFKTLASFIRKYFQLIRRESPDLVLFYDAMSGVAVYPSLWLPGKKPVFWYHNHDVIPLSHLKKFSLLNFAYQIEQKLIRHLQIFSLPADERKASFNFTGFKGKYSLLPNYPSRFVYQHVSKATQSSTEIRVIYQGNINVGHGIEEMLDLLPIRINGKSVRLILIGFIFGGYEVKLSEKIMEKNLDQYVELHSPMPYHSLPSFTNQQHIGLAIYTGKDIMNVSLGTASNKIYEYTACGIPFLYYDAAHFRKHLTDMPWAIPTDLSTSSLIDSIKKIDDEYSKLSLMARKEFEERLNFENVFIRVLNHAHALINPN